MDPITVQLIQTRQHVNRCARALRSVSIELERLVKTAVARDCPLDSLHLALEAVCNTLEMTTLTCGELRATIERFPVRA